jgi:hypothetical protein
MMGWTVLFCWLFICPSCFSPSPDFSSSNYEAFPSTTFTYISCLFLLFQWWNGWPCSSRNEVYLTELASARNCSWMVDSYCRMSRGAVVCHLSFVLSCSHKPTPFLLLIASLSVSHMCTPALEAGSHIIYWCKPGAPHTAWPDWEFNIYFINICCKGLVFWKLTFSSPALYLICSNWF